MSLDPVSISMIDYLVKGRSVLCLGYPELPNKDNAIAWLEERGSEKVHVVDLIAHQGFERIVDLNERQVWPQRYGLVINPGTVEHCFNVAQAWMNSWNALEIGGYVLHVAPVTMLNHGFWNVNPVAVMDWCEANGGRVVDMKFARNGTQEIVQPGPIAHGTSGRGQFPPETVMYALCQKTSDISLRWPAQGVYRR